MIPVVSLWFRTYGFGEILPELLIGAYPRDTEDVGMLEWAGVRRVLNLVEDEEYEPGEREAVTQAYAAAGIEEHRLNFADYGALPAEALEAGVQEVTDWLAERAVSYVHCRAGWQRSAAIAAGVVATVQGLDIDEALQFVQDRKPSADPLPHQREDLRQWWDARR
ncbi:MAG: dual specificity protein phosphatase family protein [Actinomycetota bacterium]|nr:dual specificity protein phosphatase family protein [Actinomycetota bacterium]